MTPAETPAPLVVIQRADRAQGIRLDERTPSSVPHELLRGDDSQSLPSRRAATHQDRSPAWPDSDADRNGLTPG
jgi:hypothetical protein